MNRYVVLLALCGALAVAVGVGLAFLPAGVTVAGIEALVAAYLIQYWKARR